MSQNQWSMKGCYLKNCNCIAACPCDTSGIPYPGRGCEGIAGMHIERGHLNNLNLHGLTWVVTYQWPGALHEGNGSVQAFIDERANQPQREALLTILIGRAGNPWFEFLASTVTTVYEPQFVAIKFEFDKRRRRARVLIAGAVETVSAPLLTPNTGAENRVVLQLPNGMEYREIEVAQAIVLRGTAAIKFEHSGTHSSLAEIEHTHAGLKV
jgi:hypothetical protein